MMKNVRAYLLLLGSMVLILLLSGCPSPVGGNFGVERASEPTVAVDPARGVVVLTEPDGSETVVASEEDGELVEAEELTDYVVFDAPKSTGRHAGGASGPRAIILGVRSDGRPGVWILYSGGMVIVPEGDGDETSELLEVISEADGFRWDDGWDYEAAALSADGAVIVGTAENPDAWWLADYLGSTPKVAVWWNLYQKDDGRYVLSRARVVAEYPTWDFQEVKSSHRGHRFHHRIYFWLRWFLNRLGLWFFAWADDYLGDLAAADDLGDAELIEVFGDGTYGIYGYDKAGDFAQAVIDRWQVLSIEPTDPPGGGGGPGENLPPWPVTGPALTTPLSPENASFQLEINGQYTTKDNFDPDKDDVTFEVADVQKVSGSGTPPSVFVDTDGYFHVTWPNPDNLSGTFTTVRYWITTNDGVATTDPTVWIEVQYN